LAKAHIMTNTSKVQHQKSGQSMHVVLLSQWYQPEPGLIGQGLAQTLQKMGHRVTVLTGFPNYPSGKLYPGYGLRPWRREVLAGVPVVRTPLYPDHSRSGFRRVLNYVSFAASSSVLGLWLVPRPDVVFVYHPPLTVGWPAWLLTRLWRVPFVYQIQDMWPETLRATGMVNSERVLSWVGRFAQWVYVKAEAICVITPGFRANLIDKGVPPEKIHVISNWVDTETYYLEQPDQTLAEELGTAGRFNIMFAGNMGEAQGLETVLDAAELLKNDPQVQFVFVGDGIALPRLQQSAESRGLNNVRFLGRYPMEDMPKLYALVDVLLVHLKDDPLFRITIPHKIFSYMAVGKPVLAALAGDAADVVTQAGAGIACPPEEPQALASAVQRFQGMDELERRKMGVCGLAAVHKLYSREMLVGEIEAVLRSAAGKS
jgi:glycosyltransferase involved in cell wall biosynthesis